MDFKIIEIEGTQILIHRFLGDTDGQYVEIKYIRPNPDDTEDYFEETVQFETTESCKQFVNDYTVESAQAFYNAYKLEA